MRILAGSLQRKIHLNFFSILLAMAGASGILGNGNLSATMLGWCSDSLGERIYT